MQGPGGAQLAWGIHVQPCTAESLDPGQTHMAVYIAHQGDTDLVQLQCIRFAPSDGCTGPGMPGFRLTIPLTVFLHPAQLAWLGLLTAVHTLVWGCDVRGAWRALWRPSCAGVEVDLWKVQQIVLACAS